MAVKKVSKRSRQAGPVLVLYQASAGADGGRSVARAIAGALLSY
jgi:hypothetical protein